MNKAEQKAAAKAAAEKTATEQPGADTPPAPEQAPDADSAAAQTEDAAPAAEQSGTDGQGAVQEQPPVPPVQEGEPELFTLAELAETFRLPSWHSEALHRMMEWEPDKQVSEDAYRKAMEGLKTRRMGG
jgi:hypothetical protein